MTIVIILDIVIKNTMQLTLIYFFKILLKIIPLSALLDLYEYIIIDGIFVYFGLRKGLEMPFFRLILMDFFFFSQMCLIEIKFFEPMSKYRRVWQQDIAKYIPLLFWN